MRSCGNKYKSVSSAVTETRLRCSSSADFCNATSSSVCVRVCLCMYAGCECRCWVYQINRLKKKKEKKETLGDSSSDWPRLEGFHVFLVCVRV